MRFNLVPIAALACVMAAPAAAQSMKVTVVPLFGVGEPVTDANGAPVGTITAIEGENLRIKTDKHEVSLPKSSFTPGNGKLIFSMTQAQLDAQVDQSLAAANAAIVAGATVKSADGAQIGKVESVGDGKVVVALDSGSKVAVPQDGARGNADGTVTVGYTAAQIASFSGGDKPAAQ